MRPSKKTDILEAALRVIEKEGITAVSFNSVAAEAGMTKAGVLYHFPSREAMLKALHRYDTLQWKERLEKTAGGKAEELSLAKRLESYIRVNSDSATYTDLVLLLETITDKQAANIWVEVLDDWTPPQPPAEFNETELNQIIAQLAADGLWQYEATTRYTLSERAKEQIIERLTHMAAS